MLGLVDCHRHLLKHICALAASGGVKAGVQPDAVALVNGGQAVRNAGGDGEVVARVALVAVGCRAQQSMSESLDQC